MRLKPHGTSRVFAEGANVFILFVVACFTVKNIKFSIWYFRENIGSTIRMEGIETWKWIIMCTIHILFSVLLLLTIIVNILQIRNICFKATTHEWSSGNWILGNQAIRVRNNPTILNMYEYDSYLRVSS